MGGGVWGDLLSGRIGEWRVSGNWPDDSWHQLAPASWVGLYLQVRVIPLSSFELYQAQ